MLTHFYPLIYMYQYFLIIFFNLKFPLKTHKNTSFLLFTGISLFILRRIRLRKYQIAME